MGEEVWGQNFSVGYKWILSIVMCNTGSISYKDMTTNGVLKLHLDHSRKKETATNEIIYLKISKPIKDMVLQPAEKQIGNSFILKNDRSPNPTREKIASCHTELDVTRKCLSLLKN